MEKKFLSIFGLILLIILPVISNAYRVQILKGYKTVSYIESNASTLVFLSEVGFYDDNGYILVGFSNGSFSEVIGISSGAMKAILGYSGTLTGIGMFDGYYGFFEGRVNGLDVILKGGLTNEHTLLMLNTSNTSVIYVRKSGQYSITEGSAILPHGSCILFSGVMQSTLGTSPSPSPPTPSPSPIPSLSPTIAPTPPSGSTSKGGSGFGCFYPYSGSIVFLVLSNSINGIDPSSFYYDDDAGVIYVFSLNSNFVVYAVPDEDLSVGGQYVTKYDPYNPPQDLPVYVYPGIGVYGNKMITVGESNGDTIYLMVFDKSSKTVSIYKSVLGTDFRILGVNYSTSSINVYVFFNSTNYYGRIVIDPTTMSGHVDELLGSDVVVALTDKYIMIIAPNGTLALEPLGDDLFVTMFSVTLTEVYSSNTYESSITAPMKYEDTLSFVTVPASGASSKTETVPVYEEFVISQPDPSSPKMDYNGTIIYPYSTGIVRTDEGYLVTVKDTLVLYSNTSVANVSVNGNVVTISLEDKGVVVISAPIGKIQRIVTDQGVICNGNCSNLRDQDNVIVFDPTTITIYTSSGATSTGSSSPGSTGGQSSTSIGLGGQIVPFNSIIYLVLVSVFTILLIVITRAGR